MNNIAYLLNIFLLFYQPQFLLFEGFSSNINDRKYLIDDFCNIAQSNILINFIKGVFENYDNPEIIHEKSMKNKCVLLDNIFNDYNYQFEKIMEYNNDSYIYFSCPFCGKNFKSYSLFNLHYKLYHMKFNESLVCPGDFCLSINCNQYYEYFNMKKNMVNQLDRHFNQQTIEKNEICDFELVLLYKENCMRLIEGCFGNNVDKYYKYYKYICNEIKCNEQNTQYIANETSFNEIFRYIFIFIFIAFSSIYLMIVWLTKYS